MISIVMTTYNGERYLSEQIESILAQTFSDFELIVCDDCSKDNSFQILKQYERKDSRIHAIQNDKNIGYALNFISIIPLCKGEYIFFADQDDIWLPNKIEKMFNYMKQKSKIDLLICKDIDFSELDNNLCIENINKPIKLKKLSKRQSLLKCAYRGLNMCLRKSFVDNVCEQYDFSIPFPAHDWLFQCFATEKDSIYLLPEILTLHRKHAFNTASLGDDNSSRFSKRLSILKKHIFHYEWAKKVFNNSEKDLIYENIYLYNKKRENILTEKKLFFVIIHAFSLIIYALYHNFPVKWILGDVYVNLFSKIRK